MKLLVINGPNINLLGLREQKIYGKKNYLELLDYIYGLCGDNGIIVECFQSNHEGAIIDKIQEAHGHIDGIIINPAAYTHTSIAILDALKAVNIPTVEVHLSDINQREDFRKHSYLAEVCQTSFLGMGFLGYGEAILYLKRALKG